MKIIKSLAILLAVGLVMAGCKPTITPTKSDAKNLVSFKFEAAKNVGVLTADAVAAYDDLSGKWKVGPLPVGTNVTALVATFEISDLASASVDGTTQISGTTSRSFASDVVYTITAEDGSQATCTIAVSVTVAKTTKDITAFSVSINSVTYPGTIVEAVVAGNPSTITVHTPSDVAVPNPLAASFTLLDSSSNVKIGSTAQVSGVTTNNYANPVDYVVTAEDLSTKTYTVTIAQNPKIASIVEFCPSYSSIYAQGGKGWVDIKILDASALSTGWKVRAGNDGYINNLISSTTDVASGILSGLANGDIIRIHEKGYTPVDTTTKTDNSSNAGIWDIAAVSNNLLNRNDGFIWIEKADGTIVDGVAFKSSTYNTTNAWPTSVGALSFLTAAVAAGQWPGDTIADAFDIGDAQLYTAKLKDAVIAASADGNRGTDWNAYQAPYVSLTAQPSTPLWAQLNTTGAATSATFSVRVTKYGTVSVDSVTANLSAVQLGGSATQALYDDGTNGDATAGDGTYSYTYAIPAATVTAAQVQVGFNASTTPALTVASVNAPIAVSNNAAPTTSTLLIADGDMEAANPAGTAPATITVANASVTGHSGSATNAMHISGSLSSNGALFTTTNSCNSNFGYSKVSFWLKTDGATIPKALNIEFGTLNSAIPANQLFQLVTDYSTAPSISPQTGSSNSFAYTTTPAANTNGSWVKVTLNAAATNTVNKFYIRAGTGTYDFWIDDLMLEP